MSDMHIKYPVSGIMHHAGCDIPGSILVLHCGNNGEIPAVFIHTALYPERYAAVSLRHVLKKMAGTVFHSYFSNAVPGVSGILEGGERMGRIHSAYNARMEFDDDSIRRMFRTEYGSYERMHRLTRICMGGILILLALFTDIPLAAKAVCMMAGCWLLAARDFHSQMQAERVLAGREGRRSMVSYTFNGAGIFADGSRLFSYGEVDRLVEDEAYYYIFRSRQNAVMVPKEAVKPEGFRQFLEEKTGRTWRQNTGLLLMDRKVLAELVLDKAARWTGR